MKEAPMNNADLKEMVKAHPFLHDMKPEHQEFISETAHLVRFEPQQIIFHEGEPANEFFLIREGKLALEAHEPGNGSALVQVLGPEDVLGWSWMFPPYAWHFTARAVQPTTMIALNGARLLIHAESEHDFGYELMKRVARIMMARLQATRRQLIAERQEAIMTA
jgi:CRP-like cAMP-binding protein